MIATLQTVAVVVGFVIVWLVIDGSFIPPLARGTRKMSVSRRHSGLRFSLRTMLISTTLVAVVLGLGVWLAS